MLYADDYNFHNPMIFKKMMIDCTPDEKSMFGIFGRKIV